MSSQYTYDYAYVTETQPMPVPAGKVDYSGYYAGEGTYSVSPPEMAGSETSESGVGSYGNTNYSTTTSSYAGSSHGDYDSAGSASGVDLNDYMQDRFSNAFDPVPLDRGIAVQAQTSGRLHDKKREVKDLREKTEARLAKSRARLAQGLQDAKKVHEDLEYTQKKMDALKIKASKKHSKEYSKARQRHPTPEA